VIRNVLFDLEGVLATEASEGKFALNPEFLAYFDRLNKEEFRIVVIQRKPDLQFSSITQQLATFGIATVINHNGVRIDEVVAQSRLRDDLVDHEISPSKTFYFWSSEGLAGKEYNNVHDMLKVQLGFAEVYGYTKKPWKFPYPSPVKQFFRYDIFGEPAVSERVNLSKEELELARQLLGLVALKMCRIFEGNASGCKDTYVSDLVWGLCQERGLEFDELPDIQFEGLVKELGSIANYNEQKQHIGAAGSLINHFFTGAFEGAVKTLEFWGLIKEHSCGIYEMKVDVDDIIGGEHPLLQQGNRKGFALAVGSFLRMDRQSPWGHFDLEQPEQFPEQFEVVVPKQTVGFFRRLSLIEQGQNGLVWSPKLEPYVNYAVGSWPPNAQEFFDCACGLKNGKDRCS